ncbi:MAG: hypothetical protein V4537_14275 [Pseudomonadota bacterium]
MRKYYVGKPLVSPPQRLPDPDDEVEAVRARWRRGYRGGRNGGLGAAKCDVSRLLGEIDRLRKLGYVTVAPPPPAGTPQTKGETDGQGS